MANNCLVTRLKGDINNDNLPILNTLVVTLPASQEAQLSPSIMTRPATKVVITTDAVDPIKTTSDGPYRDFPIEISSGGPITFFCESLSKETKFFVTSVYDVSNISPFATPYVSRDDKLRVLDYGLFPSDQFIVNDYGDFYLDLTKKFLEDSDHALRVELRNVTGGVTFDVERLTTPITTIGIVVQYMQDTNNVVGSTLKLAQIFNVAERIQLPHTAIQGNISDFFNLPNLRYLILSNCYAVSGVLENLVESVALRETQPEYYYFELFGTQVTLKGNVLTNSIRVTINGDVFEVHSGNLDTSPIVATYNKTTGEWTYN